MWWILILIALIIVSSLQQGVKNKTYNEIYKKAKKNTLPTGKLLQSPYSSKNRFLDFMGSFLKHKKHEWIFIAFSKNHEVYKFWIDKGNNEKFVDLKLDFYEIADICQNNGYNHLIVGHNHPAGILSPSRQDRIFLKDFLDFFEYYGITVEHYLFVADNRKKYGLSFFQ